MLSIVHGPETQVTSQDVDELFAIFDVEGAREVGGSMNIWDNAGKYFHTRQFHQLPNIKLTCLKCDVLLCFAQGCCLELIWTRSTVDLRLSLSCLAGQL